MSPAGTHSHAWSHSTHRCVHCGIYAAGTSQDGNHGEDHQHIADPPADTVTIRRDDLIWLLGQTGPDIDTTRAWRIATEAGIDISELDE